MKQLKYAVVLLLLCVLTACGSEPVEKTEIFAMDTMMELTFYGENGKTAAAQAEDMLRELETLCSRTQEQSVVSALNRGTAEPVEAGQTVCGILEAAAVYSSATGGAFDVTVAPIMDAWGFTGTAFRVPRQEELAQLLGCVGMERVFVSEQNTVHLQQGTQVDLGGIAKGYAADRVEELLRQNKIRSGLALLGGNVYAHGTKPDGTPWRIGVKDPRDPDSYVGVLLLEDAYAVTSGGYQRYFEENGAIYHHIIDPATGCPADSGLSSVTVVAPANAAQAAPGNGTMCDAFSTALFVMGTQEALEFWRTADYGFELVLVTDSGQVLLTEGLAARFEKNEASGYCYEIIKN